MQLVDNFAGGGGASLGIEQALGRPVDIAVNHDAEAVAMHRANHPRTTHYLQDVWHVDPAAIRLRGPIALAWFSPDCTHHSKAKGSAPIRREGLRSRDLAWVVIRWAREAQPAVIMLENVEEFADWGPLVAGRPDKARAGETFRHWIQALRDAGYAVEWRELRACDYGAPTFRKRLFVIARRDGLPIVWPEPTHGPGLSPYRTAAECIDWTLPVHSIFLTTAEGRKLGVRRPLAHNTLSRIARGLRRYVIEADRPFIVPVTHSGDRRIYSIDDPVRTVTAARRGELALVTAHMAQHNTRIHDDGSVQPRVRLLRPSSRTYMAKAEFSASNWNRASEQKWRPLWDAELAGLPTHHESHIHLAVGLLLPVWDRIKSDTMRVRRLTTDDGQALIGRLIEVDQVRDVRRAFGLSAGPTITGEQAVQAVMHRGKSFAFDNGWRLARRRVMGADRIEISGPVDTDITALKLAGCIVEIIQYRARVFVPDAHVLARVLERWPLDA